MSNLETEVVLTAPFALEPTMQPHHWEVEARFTIGGEQLTDIFRGPYINPPIQRWHLRYRGEENWSLLESDSAARFTITEPYEAQLDPTLAPSAEAETIVEFAGSMPVWFDTWTNGTLLLEIDGKLLQSGVSQPDLAGLTHPRPALRFGPVTVAAGTHVIKVRLNAPTAPDESLWVFGVLLVDDTGAPIYRCAYAMGEQDRQQ